MHDLKNHEEYFASAVSCCDMIQYDTYNDIMQGVRYGTGHSSWVQAWTVTPRSAAMSLAWHILLLCLAVENDAIDPKFGRKNMTTLKIKRWKHLMGTVSTVYH